ncbi:DUF6891 domain-containing protein [Sphingobium sp.]|uniref:DUF6891 domain-containing protein n=1 Tax=Sphingobium sp. TaxID=1912891 RepID=UPI002B829191|nr:hypothetical protein [Sphingobium sp.]HUD94656.1 hypothetical protein [Sphingobium sp.]
MFGTLWNRIFGTRATTTEPQKDIPAYDPVEALRVQVRRDVVGGFYDEDAILTNAHDVFEEELPMPVLRREASASLRVAMAEHRAAEQGWTHATDCDRLDAAFVALEAEGVIARQNFTCCGTCGASEIWDEIEAAQKAGEPADGYAFFHMQDTESAIEGHGLCLNYGACEEGDEAAIAIGQRIVDQLEAHGLAVDWDGSLGQRIGIALDWKKRRSVVAMEG